MLNGIRSRLSYANVVATGALFVALGGGAYALSGVPDRGGVFHGCVDNKTGVLRVVSRASSCRKAKTVRRGRRRVRIPGETAIAWNQQGVPGAPGTPGAKGDTGAPGTARGYGLVKIPCTVGGSCPVLQGQNATVTHPFGGVFCINVPGVDSSRTAVSATLADVVAGDFIQTIATPGSCPGLEVVTRDGSGNADKSFFFVVP